MHRIDPETFTQGSLLHFLSLFVTVALTAGFVLLARKTAKNGSALRPLRYFLVAGCLVAAALGT